MNEWPSLLDPNISQDSNSEKQKAALTPEEFEYCIQEMKEFANYVIRIALYHLHVNQHDPQAKEKYDKLFVNTEKQQQDPLFESRFESYIEEFVPDNQTGEEEVKLKNQNYSIEEARDQMFNSSIMIMFKTLKTIRIQDSLGMRP